MRGKVMGVLATGLSIVGSLLFAAVMDFAGWDPDDSASGWIWWTGALFALLFTNISAVLTVIAATVIGFIPAIVARRKK